MSASVDSTTYINVAVYLAVTVVAMVFSVLGIERRNDQEGGGGFNILYCLFAAFMWFFLSFFQLWIAPVGSLIQSPVSFLWFGVGLLYFVLTMYYCVSMLMQATQIRRIRSGDI
jgi:drug/metabolite transporter (DMT)-like permease